MIGSTMKEVITMFIELGRTTTALTEAARWGETELVLQLLGDGLAVDARDENGGTALMKASSAGNLKMMRLLLERGADVNAVHESEGMTPLMWSLAALHGKAKYRTLTDFLLKAGARVGIKDLEGKTALDYARTRDNPELERMIEAAALREREEWLGAGGRANPLPLAGQCSEGAFLSTGCAALHPWLQALAPLGRARRERRG